MVGVFGPRKPGKPGGDHRWTWDWDCQFDCSEVITVSYPLRDTWSRRLSRDGDHVRNAGVDPLAQPIVRMITGARPPASAESAQERQHPNAQNPREISASMTMGHHNADGYNHPRYLTPNAQNTTPHTLSFPGTPQAGIAMSAQRLLEETDAPHAHTPTPPGSPLGPPRKNLQRLHTRQAQIACAPKRSPSPPGGGVVLSPGVGSARGKGNESHDVWALDSLGRKLKYTSGLPPSFPRAFLGCFVAESVLKRRH